MSLSYAATVPRHLVHRRSPADVLLTDYETVDGTHRAAVQFPTSHRMFAPVRRTHDSLMVAEALRQAISLFSHVNHGVPLDHVVFIEHSRFEILDPLSVDDIEDYDWYEGELLGGMIIGWNFGQRTGAQSQCFKRLFLMGLQLFGL